MQQFLNQIPKPLLVAVVFAIAAAFILLANPQYTQCQAQVEIFRKNLVGEIFTSQGKRMTFSPRLSEYISTCKRGNGPGGCFELFRALRKMLREMRAFPESCQGDLAEIEEVRRALTEPMYLMIQIAWGDEPPEGPEQRYRWLEKGDIALFCDLKRNFIALYGPEEFDKIKLGVGAALPGEAADFEKGVCTNCEYRKSADKVMSPNDIWKRTLLSTPCSSFQF